MDLDIYSWSTRKPLKKIAEEIGCSLQSLSLAKTKQVTPGPGIALRLIEISEGKITYEELLSDEDKKNLEEWRAKNSRLHSSI